MLGGGRGGPGPKTKNKAGHVFSPPLFSVVLDAQPGSQARNRKKGTQIGKEEAKTFFLADNIKCVCDNFVNPKSHDTNEFLEGCGVSEQRTKASCISTGLSREPSETIRAIWPINANMRNGFHHSEALLFLKHAVEAEKAATSNTSQVTFRIRDFCPENTNKTHNSATRMLKYLKRHFKYTQVATARENTFSSSTHTGHAIGTSALSLSPAGAGGRGAWVLAHC